MKKSTVPIMANFNGHIMNGGTIYLVGIYWLYNALYRYLLCQRERGILPSGDGRKFRMDFTFPLKNYPKYPIMPVIVTGLITIIILGEIIDGNVAHRLTMWEHLMLYIAFGILSAFCAWTHYKPMVLPDGEYLLFLLAIIINMIVLSGHNHNGPHLELKLHGFVMFNWVVVILGTLVEMKNRGNAAIACLRPIFLMVQGAWMASIAWILYSPTFYWPLSDNSVMFLNVYYAWHLIAELLIFIGMYFFVYEQVQKMNEYEVSEALDIEYRCVFKHSATQYTMLKEEESPLV